MTDSDAASAPHLAIAPAIPWSDATRQAAFERCLAQWQSPHGLLAASLRLASADASFRRYFRIDTQNGGSCIIMDAPPAQEDCAPFVKVAQLMAQAGIRVPQVLAWNQPDGFLLLSDLGTQTLLEAINGQPAPSQRDAYLQAIEILVRWQQASQPGVLPAYDAPLLRRELALFPQWYLHAHRRCDITAALRQQLDSLFEALIAHNLSSASVYVHRDFMPRNLMLEVAQGRPVLGVLDFQDAVYGPISYDIASLMRDAFLSCDEDFVLDITVRYWQLARRAGLPVPEDFGAFYRAVEWMGLQRHLKVLGIFARLTLRDGKPRYLADTPRFIGYARATASRYRELTPLLRLIDQVEGLEARSGYAFGRL